MERAETSKKKIVDQRVSTNIPIKGSRMVKMIRIIEINIAVLPLHRLSGWRSNIYFPHFIYFSINSVCYLFFQILFRSFQENPKPNDNQRKLLGEELGVELFRVKFWFQNKQNQHKRKDDIQQNKKLKAENFKLRMKNSELNEKRRSPFCVRCGVDKLWVENAQLREKINRSLRILALHGGVSLLSNPSGNHLRIVDSSNDNTGGDNYAAGIKDGKKSILKLAKKMVVGFFAGVTGSVAYDWVVLSGIGVCDVQLAIKETTYQPGGLAGLVLNASTTFWLPVDPRKVYDTLGDETSYAKLDIFMNGANFEKMDQIAVGHEEENIVSLLRLKASNMNSNELINKEIIILQESSFGATSSYVIYAPMLASEMNRLINGGDPDKVNLLPSGFVIVPDDDSSQTPGSLVTVSLQIMTVSNTQAADLSHGGTTVVKNLVLRMEDNIKMCFRTSAQRGSSIKI